jgi:hypothetical protein
VDFEEAQLKGVGALTGIPLTSAESKYGPEKKAIDPDMMWLKTRLEGGGILGLINEPGIQKVQDLDEIELEEEVMEIELNEEEPAFLANQTTKTASVCSLSRSLKIQRDRWQGRLWHRSKKLRTVRTSGIRGKQRFVRACPTTLTECGPISIAQQLPAR